MLLKACMRELPSSSSSSTFSVNFSHKSAGQTSPTNKNLTRFYYSIVTDHAHLPFLVHSFSCPLSHPQSIFSYPYPSLRHPPSPNVCIWKPNHHPFYVPHV